MTCQNVSCLCIVFQIMSYGALQPNGLQTLVQLLGVSTCRVQEAIVFIHFKSFAVNARVSFCLVSNEKSLLLPDARADSVQLNSTVLRWFLFQRHLVSGRSVGPAGAQWVGPVCVGPCAPHPVTGGRRAARPVVALPAPRSAAHCRSVGSSCRHDLSHQRRGSGRIKC